MRKAIALSLRSLWVRIPSVILFGGVVLKEARVLVKHKVGYRNSSSPHRQV